jgi:SAM-dependent methyltransferase
MQQVGTDYSDSAAVEIFDERMAVFRDVDAENRRILDTIKLPLGSSILEIGCATGRFARPAAAAGYAVCAIDVSEQMLEFAKRKSQEEGLTAIDRFDQKRRPTSLARLCFERAPSVVHLGLEYVSHPLIPRRAKRGDDTPRFGARFRRPSIHRSIRYDYFLLANNSRYPSTRLQVLRRWPPHYLK